MNYNLFSINTVFSIYFYINKYLRIDNVVFKNCHSYSNYLILVSGRSCIKETINVKIINSEFNGNIYVFINYIIYYGYILDIYVYN